MVLLISLTEFDINSSVDKRTLVLANEAEIMERLRVKLAEWFEMQQRVKAFDEPVLVLEKRSA